MPKSISTEITDEEVLDQIAAIRSEVRLPGYWTSIADNCRQWAGELNVAPFWATVATRLAQWRGEFASTNNGASLLPEPTLPGFCGKSAESIRDKVLRKCHSDKAYVDRAVPRSGPPVPGIGDLVRTRIRCTYIDGVEFLTNKLFDLANELNLSPARQREGRIEGYFAQHLVVKQDVLYRFAGQTQLVKVRSEIQVASEMATSMWSVAHSLYEKSRGAKHLPEDWQWNPSDPQFFKNQLGHTIHLADGLLVHLRDSTLSIKDKQ